MELDRRRAYIETVVDTVAAGVLSIDTDGVVTNLNPSAERILGLRPTGFGAAGQRGIQGVWLDLFQQIYDRVLKDALDDLRWKGRWRSRANL